ncbi:MAG: methyl-accepting chemotaxis protein [Candidatus Omnitrophica bacterium]|nr:methyl-accepting chemotaxis protein [Candidatus Omnitrophota bacterium]
MKNRRKHFLVDKSLQFHYLLYIVLTLTLVAGVGIVGSYFGIWGSAIKIFSEESLRESMLTAAQLTDYERARRPFFKPQEAPSIRNYQDTALLSERQREMIREIMNETTRRMVGLGIFLVFFIGWGSIFLTHKIAGPVFKLKQYLHRVEQGDLTTRIQFRKFDEIHKLADDFNATIAALDAHVGTMKRMVRESSSETVLNTFKKELSKFKTSN